MTKTLIKKQLMEVFSWIYQDKRTGKKRSSNRSIGFAAMYVLVLCFLSFSMYGMLRPMCSSLVAENMGWMYITIMGVMTVVFGIFGSVFTTYSTIYQAKDNDILLAMPVPQGRILFARMFGVYVLGLVFELVIMIPGMIAWFQVTSLGPVEIIFSLMIPIVLSILTLSLTAILGWIIAAISSRIKGKNIKNMISVVMSLAFMFAYIMFYQKAFTYLQQIIADPQSAEGIKKTLFLFYHMGLAAEGKGTSMVMSAAITALLFYVIFLVMERSFIKLNTTNKGASKHRSKSVTIESRPVGQALFRKEMRRFLGSPNYMLNCGLGCIMMVVGAVVLLVKSEMAGKLLAAVPSQMKDVIPLLATAAICMIATMNDTTAPSVSLEGKSLWVLKSLPVSARQILLAKIKLQIMLTVIPVAVLTAAVEWVLKPDIVFMILMPAVIFAFMVFMAAFGLFMNLKNPDFTWTNEVVPIKQSMSVLVTLFGGWGAVILLTAIGFLLSQIAGPTVCLIIIVAVVLSAAFGMMRWIMDKGVKVWEKL